MSRWGGSKLGYINHATKRKGHDRLWHIATNRAAAIFWSLSEHSGHRAARCETGQ